MARAAPPSPQIALILWGSMVMSHLVFAGVGWFLALNAPAGSEPLDIEVLWVLTALGGAAPMVAPMVVRRLIEAPLAAQRDASRDQRIAAIFPMVILGFALRELGAVIGFVILFLWRDPVFWAIPAGIALGSMILAAPTPARLDELIESGVR